MKYANEMPMFGIAPHGVIKVRVHTPKWYTREKPRLLNTNKDAFIPVILTWSFGMHCRDELEKYQKLADGKTRGMGLEGSVKIGEKDQIRGAVLDEHHSHFILANASTIHCREKRRLKHARSWILKQTRKRSVNTTWTLRGAMKRERSWTSTTPTSSWSTTRSQPSGRCTPRPKHAGSENVAMAVDACSTAELSPGPFAALGLVKRLQPSQCLDLYWKYCRRTRSAILCSTHATHR